MRKKLFLLAACFTLCASVFALAQTAPTPPTATTPDSVETGKPGGSAPSPGPTNPDQETAATGAASREGTSAQPTSTEPTNRGSVDSARAAGKGAANGEGPGEKSKSGSERGTATASDVGSSGSHKTTPQSRSHAVPSSGKASRAGSIKQPDGRSDIASRVPSSPGDEHASADQFLRDAQTALRNRHTDEAQQALERAETRLLGGLNGQEASSGSQSQAVAAVEQAREALGHRRFLRPDTAQTSRMIDRALAQSTGGSTTSGSSGLQSVP